MSNFDGTWTLYRSTSFDDIMGAEHIWEGSFMECMTVIAYEGMGPYQFKINNKTIVVLFDLTQDEWEDDLHV